MYIYMYLKIIEIDSQVKFEIFENIFRQIFSQFRVLGPGNH